jgi:hypothetical protein
MIELYDNFFHLGCPNIQKKNIFKGWQGEIIFLLRITIYGSHLSLP